MESRSRSAGLLSQLSTETQTGSLWVGLGQVCPLAVCLYLGLLGGGTSPQWEYLHAEASGSLI